MCGLSGPTLPTHDPNGVEPHGVNRCDPFRVGREEVAFMRPARLRQAVNKVQGRNALHEPILGALLQKKTKPNHGLKAQ